MARAWSGAGSTWGSRRSLPTPTHHHHHHPPPHPRGGQRPSHAMRCPLLRRPCTFARLVPRRAAAGLAHYQCAGRLPLHWSEGHPLNSVCSFFGPRHHHPALRMALSGWHGQLFVMAVGTKIQDDKAFRLDLVAREILVTVKCMYLVSTFVAWPLTQARMGHPTAVVDDIFDAVPFARELGLSWTACILLYQIKFVGIILGADLWSYVKHRSLHSRTLWAFHKVLAAAWPCRAGVFARLALPTARQAPRGAAGPPHAPLPPLKPVSRAPAPRAARAARAGAPPVPRPDGDGWFRTPLGGDDGDFPPHPAVLQLVRRCVLARGRKQLVLPPRVPRRF